MNSMKIIMEGWRSYLNEATAVKYAAGGLGDPDKLTTGQVAFEWGTYTGRHSSLDYYVADRMRGSLGPIQRRGDPYTYEQPEEGMLKVVSGPYRNAEAASQSFAAPAFPDSRRSPGMVAASEAPPEGDLTDDQIRAENERISRLPPEEQQVPMLALQARVAAQDERSEAGANSFDTGPGFSNLHSAGQAAAAAAEILGDMRDAWVRSTGGTVSFRNSQGTMQTYDLTSAGGGGIRNGRGFWGMTPPDSTLTGFGTVRASSYAQEALEDGLPNGFLDAATEANDTFFAWRTALRDAIQETQQWIRTNTYDDLTNTSAPEGRVRAAKEATGEAVSNLVDACLSYINKEHPWIETDDEFYYGLIWTLGGARGFQFFNQGIALLNLSRLAREPAYRSRINISPSQMSEFLPAAL